jgi:hypothetical protein
VEDKRVLGLNYTTQRLMNTFVIDLYEAWGKPEKANEWRAKLPQKEAVKD